MSSPSGKFISIDDANRESVTGLNDGGTTSDSSKGGNDSIGGPEDTRIEAEYVEPASIPIADYGTDTGDSPRRTKRGTIDRRTKAGRQGSTVSPSVGFEGLSIKDLLIGIHAFGASISGIEELEIDETEGKKLGDAVEELSKIYGKTINPKTAAWVNFAAAAGVVYGPRIIAYRARMESETKAAPATAPKPGPQPVNKKPAEKPLPQFPTPSDFWSESLAGY